MTKPEEHPDYSATRTRIQCVYFIRKNYGKAVFPVGHRWGWRNSDNRVFLHKSKADACSELCFEMGVTVAELESGIAR